MKKYWKPALLAALLIAVLGIVYAVTRPETVQGDKSVVVEIIYEGSTQKTYTYHTDEEYLGAVLKGEELVEGAEGPYGLYINTVDGVTADESAQEWWCITKDGEEHMDSVDNTVIADGDKFELTLKAGYDE